MFLMFCVILSIIINLRTGIFPDCLKLARVTPISKGGDSTNAGNCRPISVLPIFSKRLEKVVFKQSYTYFEQNNILYEHQYRFRKHMSTVQALLNHMQFMHDMQHRLRKLCYICILRFSESVRYS